MLFITAPGEEKHRPLFLFFLVFFTFSVQRIRRYLFIYFRTEYRRCGDGIHQKLNWPRISLVFSGETKRENGLEVGRGIPKTNHMTQTLYLIYYKENVDV